MNTFIIEKATGTQADTLTTYGLAEIGAEVLSVQADAAARSYNIQLRDEGACHRLICDPPLDLDALDQLGKPIEPAPLVVTVKNREQLDGVNYHRRMDYEKEKRQRDEYLEFRQQNKNWDRLPADQRPPAPATPHPHWDIFRAINPAALPGYNNVLLNWAKTADAQAEVLRLLFRLFSTFPNDLAQAEKDWKALDKQHGWGIGVETTTLQLYNPDQGKGQNRAKADALSMANVSGFWLLELLKITGLYKAGVTRTLLGVKDRKNYVIAPLALTYTESNQVMDKFKQAFQVRTYPSITSDILAIITYTEALFAYAEERPDSDWLPRKRKPRNVVKGFYTAFYKDLGNAVATMNVSFLALPAWITVEKPEDITRNRELLEEIRRLTYTIDESHSDGYTLLSRLRDFLSGSELTAFFDFTASYAGYYMSQRERSKFAHQLSATFVKEIIMGIESKLTDILDDPGFQNVAYAIRQSTVVPVFNKVRYESRRFEIRYGLAQELARNSHSAPKFIEALSEFITAYNTETLRDFEHEWKMKRSPKFPHRNLVKEADIASITKWIKDEDVGVRVVAHLLIACGYSDDRPHKGVGDETSSANEQSVDATDSDSSTDDSE